MANSVGTNLKPLFFLKLILSAITTQIIWNNKYNVVNTLLVDFLFIIRLDLTELVLNVDAVDAVDAVLRVLAVDTVDTVDDVRCDGLC